MLETPSYTADYFSRNVGRFSKFLGHLADRPCNIVEIGCCEGRATRWLLDNITTHPESTIACLDIYWQPLFVENLEGHAKLALHEGPSRDILPTLPKQRFDFVLIDDSHEAVDVLDDAVLSFVS